MTKINYALMRWGKKLPLPMTLESALTDILNIRV